ncbi:MAG: hypothetical protein AB7K68_09085 [Bacteriovoracia bacterium]
MEAQIAAFLKKAHPSRNEDPAISPNLFTDNWLDSLLQLRLLSFLEQECKIYVPSFQVSLKNFQTVSSIAALVSKLQNAGPLA